MRTILTEIEAHLHAGDRVVMVSRQTSRLSELLGEAGHTIVPTEDLPALPPPGLTLVQGVMEEGWKLDYSLRERGSWKMEAESSKEEEDQQPASSNPLPATRFCLFTDAELFGWGKPKPRRPLRPHAVAPEVFFADVRPDDFVVHIEHGIGRFRGLIKMAVDNVDREYLKVEYAQGDQLYVPVHQADRLARYVGSGDATPNLHRLGTAEWEQIKQRARRAVAEIADELLELYASREVVQGHAFAPDAAWQHELESSFPYIETEDQLVAIEAVKQRHGAAAADGSPDLRRRGLWQDRGRVARGVQGRDGRQAGGRVGAHHRAGPAALHQLQPPAGRLPCHRRHALALPDPQPAGSRADRAGQRQHGPRDRHPPPVEQRRGAQGSRPADRG